MEMKIKNQDVIYESLDEDVYQSHIKLLKEALIKVANDDIEGLSFNEKMELSAYVHNHLFIVYSLRAGDLHEQVTINGNILKKIINIVESEQPVIVTLGKFSRILYEGQESVDDFTLTFTNVGYIESKECTVENLDDYLNQYRSFT